MDITLARTFLEQVNFIKGTRRKNSRRWPWGNTRQPKKDKSNKNKTESLNDAKQLLIPLEKGEIDKTMPMINFGMRKQETSHKAMHQSSE